MYLFTLFQGNIAVEEMSKTFNCGIGAVLIVDKSLADQIVKQLNSTGEEASIIGKVEKQTSKEIPNVANFQLCNLTCNKIFFKNIEKKN